MSRVLVLRGWDAQHSSYLYEAFFGICFEAFYTKSLGLKVKRMDSSVPVWSFAYRTELVLLIVMLVDQQDHVSDEVMEPSAEGSAFN